MGSIQRKNKKILTFPQPIFVGPLLPSKNTFPNHKYFEIRFLSSPDDSFFYFLSSSLRGHLSRSGFYNAQHQISRNNASIDKIQEIDNASSNDRNFEGETIFFSHLIFSNYYTSFIEIEQKIEIKNHNLHGHNDCGGGDIEKTDIKNDEISKEESRATQDQGKMDHYAWKSIFARKLMPHSNYEKNSQSKFTIYAADFNSLFQDEGYPISGLSDSKKLIHLRIKLFQPSPLWNQYNITKVKCYGKIYLGPSNETCCEKISSRNHLTFKSEDQAKGIEEINKNESNQVVKNLYKIAFLHDNLHTKLETLHD